MNRLKTCLSLLIVVVLLGAFAPAALAQGGVTASISNNANLRSGPGTQYPSLGVLRHGTPFTLTGRDSTGVWAYGTASTGATGWVAARYLTISPDIVFSLPITTASGAPAAPAAAQPASPVVVNPAPSGGCELGGHILGYGQEAWMRTAGMTWVKRQYLYSVGDGVGSVAAMIAEAHAHGFRILVSVPGHPHELESVGDYLSRFASFLGDVAAAGADAIEVWNEPNIDREWPTGRIDPGWFTQMLAAAYNAIKARNPNTLVISGAPAPTGAEGAFGSARVWNDDRYVAGMAAAGAARYMDCIGIHYNEGIIPPSQRSGDPRGDSYYTRYFWGMVDTYWNAFGGQRPLCFTELGYLSPEGYGVLPSGFAWAQNVSVAQQAAWLDEAVSLARGSGRVRLLIVWNVDFTGNFGEDPMGGYAIVRPGGACPACEALAR